MKIGIHQPNFIPPFSYFLKMAVCDIFVIMENVPFSKDGFQNYQCLFGKKFKNPVWSGLIPIKDKLYTTNQNLIEVNMAIITAIMGILNISSTKIQYDFATDKTKTDRIVEICKRYGANEYVANSSATEKYLDVKLLNENGIEFVPLVCDEKKNILEVLAELGIEGTRNYINSQVKRNNKYQLKEIV